MSQVFYWKQTNLFLNVYIFFILMIGKILGLLVSAVLATSFLHLAGIGFSLCLAKASRSALLLYFTFFSLRLAKVSMSAELLCFAYFLISTSTWPQGQSNYFVLPFFSLPRQGLKMGLTTLFHLFTL